MSAVGMIVLGAWLTIAAPPNSHALYQADGAQAALAASKIYLPMAKKTIVEPLKTTQSPVIKLGSTGGFGDAVEFGDNHAYVGQGHELVVFDLTKAQPVEVGHVVLPGIALQIELNDTYAYVITLSSELAIVDVRNPLQPTVIGQWLKDQPKVKFESVLVRNGRAYVSTSQTLFVLDVADPAQIRMLGRYDLPDGPQFIKVTPHPTDGRFVFMKTKINHKDSYVLYDLRDPQQIRALDFSLPEHVRDGNKFYFWDCCYNSQPYDFSLVMYDMSQATDPKKFILQPSEKLLDGLSPNFVWNGYLIGHQSSSKQMQIFRISNSGNNPGQSGITAINRFTLPNCAYELHQANQYLLALCPQKGANEPTITVFDMSNLPEVKQVGQSKLPMKIDRVSLKQQRVIFSNSSLLATLPVTDLNTNFNLSTVSIRNPLRELGGGELISLGDQFALPGVTTTLISSVSPFTATYLYSATQASYEQPYVYANISPTLSVTVKVSTTNLGSNITLWPVGSNITQPIGSIPKVYASGISVLVNADWLLVKYYASDADKTMQMYIEFWHLANPQDPKLGAIYSTANWLKRCCDIDYTLYGTFEDSFLIKPNVLLILKTGQYEFLDISNPKEVRILSQHPIRDEQLITHDQAKYPTTAMIQQNNQQLIFSLNHRHIDIFDISAERPKHLSMFDLGRDIFINWGKNTHTTILAKFSVHQQRLYTFYRGGEVRVWDISKPSQPEQLAIWEFSVDRFLLHPAQAKAYFTSGETIGWLDIADPALPILLKTWKPEWPSRRVSFDIASMALISNTSTLAVGLGVDGIVFLR
ncbi:MAG: hypothetical protein KIH69_010880 [Anaerolineae bacterium]|nr:hypothetical protein [Anaerolineae bacterium]